MFGCFLFGAGGLGVSGGRGGAGGAGVGFAGPGPGGDGGDGGGVGPLLPAYTSSPFTSCGEAVVEYMHVLFLSTWKVQAPHFASDAHPAQHSSHVLEDLTSEYLLTCAWVEW
jgi:hypothetical protein